MGKYVFSLIYIFNRRQKEGRKRERERETGLKNVNANATKVSLQKQFMRWINFKLYPNLLLGSCNVNKTTCVDEVDAKVRCQSMQQKKTWEKWIHFLSRLTFMQAATKMLLDVNTPTQASLHLSALILSCCQSQKQSHAKRSAHRHLPTNMDSNSELI